MSRYDYIIAGAGAAGLSLIVHMLHSGKFSDKKILLIDRSPKIQNDRTWCFWEEQPGLFESIVCRQWNRMWFHGVDGKSNLHKIAPYQYKMIRGINFYDYAFSLIKLHQNISIVYGEIESIYSDNTETYLIVDGSRIDAKYIFSSLPVEVKKSKNVYSLIQHFMGWFVRTEKDIFNPDEATIMDFRTKQCDDTRFVYVMPFSKNEALVEYTVFSETMLNDPDYNEGLNDYLSTTLNLNSNEFSVLNVEAGKIPMTNYDYPSSDHNIIYIGSAGGNTKASSGYTFRFIQKHSCQIVDALIKNLSPHINVNEKKYNFYDSILLKILIEKKLPGALIFTQLFEHNEMNEVFKFLDNETSIPEDIKLISTLPKGKFLSAAFSHLFQ